MAALTPVSQVRLPEAPATNWFVRSSLPGFADESRGQLEPPQLAPTEPQPQLLQLRPLLLLSRDLQSECRDLQFQESGTAELPVQPVLPGFEHLVVPKAVARKPARTGWASRNKSTEDPLVSIYLRRLKAQDVAAKGIAAYEYQLRWMRRRAAQLRGQPVSSSELFSDHKLLGQVLTADADHSGHRQLSRWTLAQRRSAARSFATLTTPELRATGHDPHSTLDLALRTYADRVGGGFRLTGGAPRKRGGVAPTPEQLRDVLHEARQAPGHRGRRAYAFFLILAETGSRVNALRELDGRDCFQMPNGRVRIFLHDKGKTATREVELSQEAGAALRSYLDAFSNDASRRRKDRLRFGEGGGIWRAASGRRWSYHSVLRTLRFCCIAAGVPVLTPHALRRAFASEASTMLPRHIVALAGGWQGLERLDDHYVQPRRQAILDKLSRISERTTFETLAKGNGVSTITAVRVGAVSL